MKREIFRREALERLASPDQLDRLMPVTSPHGWIALGGFGLAIMMAIVWGFLGRIDTTVSGDGVLTRLGGVEMVQASHAGVVSRVSVQTDDLVQKGQILMQIVASGSGNAAPAAVRSPKSGRVLNILVIEGDEVEQGLTLLTVESPNRPLQAVIFVPADEGYQVEVNMDVQITPATALKHGVDHLFGTVSEAGRFPASRLVLIRSLQSEERASQFLSLGPVLKVVVDLAEAKSLEKIYSGTPCRARITVDERRPIDLVLAEIGGSRSH